MRQPRSSEAANLPILQQTIRATRQRPLGDLYGFFYYSPVLVATIILIKKISQETDQKILKVSKILLVGNFIISIPVIIGFVMMFTGNHYLIDKIESVMCKFAFSSNATQLPIPPFATAQIKFPSVSNF